MQVKLENQGTKEDSVMFLLKKIDELEHDEGWDGNFTLFAYREHTTELINHCNAGHLRYAIINCVRALITAHQSSSTPVPPAEVLLEIIFNILREVSSPVDVTDKITLKEEKQPKDDEL
jgi:hypothetical protein